LTVTEVTEFWPIEVDAAVTVTNGLAVLLTVTVAVPTAGLVAPLGVTEAVKVAAPP
jgi:hypothetical protein